MRRVFKLLSTTIPPEQMKGGMLEILQLLAIIAPEEDRGYCLEVCADIWLKCVVPGEDREVLVRFLDAFLTPEAFGERCKALYGSSKVQAIFSSSLLIAMAFGEFGDGVPQRLLDEQLGKWLRGVILERNIAPLKDLIITLECSPRSDATLAELDNRLRENARDTYARKVIIAFTALLEQKKQIPWKEEVGNEAGVYEDSRRSEALKAVGLQGLREGKPSGDDGCADDQDRQSWEEFLNAVGSFDPSWR